MKQFVATLWFNSCEIYTHKVKNVEKKIKLCTVNIKIVCVINMQILPFLDLKSAVCIWERLVSRL
jgi:hypothetical protein